MDKLSDDTHKVEKILSHFLREYGLDKKILEAKVLVAWANAVGEPVAHNTRPISLVSGTLTVYTANSVLTSELSLLEQHVIEKINDTVGTSAVRKLRFFVRPFKSIQRKMQPRRHSKRLNELETVELSPNILERIEQRVAKVEDAELKTCLKRVFIKQSKRAVIDNDPLHSNLISSRHQSSHSKDSTVRDHGFQ